MRHLIISAVTALIALQAAVCSALDPYAGNDPYWILLHEPAVIRELKLTPAQRESYRGALDSLDLQFFPLRNQDRDKALAGMERVVADARREMKNLLQPAQVRRIHEILLRKQGSAAFRREEISSALHLTDSQRERVASILDTTQKAIDELAAKAQNDEGRAALEKRAADLRVDEQRKILALLKPDQQASWKKALGAPFDLTRLRQPQLKVPELIDTGVWINSSPVRLEGLRGKVVVVHFYASGCINCIHNYPSYRGWQADYKDSEVALVGIHTPETESEREVEGVRQKAAEEKLAFPILIDGKGENWNAWGNSMWPAVYLIDKRGYLREFWPGELKWNGYDADQFLRGRIKELLEERDP